jgi:hypothetical protein
MPLEFKNPDVAEKYSSNAEDDFLISVPDHYGPRKPFSEIDLKTADELLRQKFYHIAVKEEKE